MFPSKSLSQASLVKDINTSPADLMEQFNYTGLFVECNGFLFFSVENELGTEIWKTDGTKEGTSMVVDLNEGAESGAGEYAYSYECVADELFFRGNNGKTGSELFKTDGTESGTVLVKDGIPGVTGSFPVGFTTFQGLLYYFTNNGNSLKLCKSDGTEAGTIEVALIEIPDESVSFYSAASSDDLLYFITSDHGGDDSNPKFQIWRSDGTEEGTSVLFKSDYYLHRIVTIGSICYFIAGTQIMKTDGTIAGTKILTNHIFPYVNNLYGFNNKLLIESNSLWISDGTDTGTFLLSDTKINGRRIVDDLFYTVSYDLTGKFHLLRTDGTIEGTENLVELPGDNSSDISLYGEIPMIGNDFIIPFFNQATGQEPGLTDGTETGTSLLKEVWPGKQSSSPRAWVELNRKVYFVATDSIHGSEIWFTDGTTEGTALLLDIKSGSKNADPRAFEILNDKFFFTANDSIFDRDVWTTNGSEESTRKYADFERSCFYIGRTSNDLYYLEGLSLYKINGNDTGKTLAASLPSDIFGFGISGNSSYNLGERLVFYFEVHNANNPTGGELWLTDGTDTGTGIIKDINPGPLGSIHYFDGTILDERLLFAANDGTHGNEVWQTDGTESGTRLLKDIYPGAAGSNPRNFVNFNDNVFFSAQENNNGSSLWRTDGTDAGTILIKEITSETSSSSIPFIVKAGDELLMAVNDQVNGPGLWKSDGTSSGTSILTSDFSSLNSAHILVDNKIFFTAVNDKNGTELWVSNGTSEGTYVIDISQGPESSNPNNFVDVEGLLYFKANRQLWRTNGTPEFTELVSNLEPIEIGYFNDYIYFSVATEEYGSELFKVPYTKYDQTVTFEPIPVKVFGDEAFQLAATSSSGLPITFTATSDKLKIEKDIVSLLKPGSVSVRASQIGNNLFNAVEESQSFCINPAQPSISLSEENGKIQLISSSESGNQWFKNSTLLPGSSGQNITIEESGVYSVQAQVDGCISEMSEEKSLILTGIPENTTNNVIIFPNPASDNLFIQFDIIKKPAKVEILDMAGRQHGIYTLKESTQIPLSQLSTGIYVLKISYADKILRRRLVKK